VEGLRVKSRRRRAEAQVEWDDVAARPLVVTPRVLAEVRGLHDRAASLAREAGNMRGRQARRERRDACEAERDLLRVLGFGNYEQFEAAVCEPSVETVADLAVETVADLAVETVADLAVELAVETAADLAQAVCELRLLCELLREERTEFASLSERGRVEAERIVAEARLDAQRAREEAAADARDMLARAQAEAAALIRNANSTVEGLRRLALERGSDDSEPAQPRAIEAPRSSN
jgi:hypothetical protein